MQVLRSDLSLRIQIKTCARVLVEFQLPLPSAFGSVTSISLPKCHWLAASDMCPSDVLHLDPADPQHTPYNSQ